MIVATEGCGDDDIAGAVAAAGGDGLESALARCIADGVVGVIVRTPRTVAGEVLADEEFRFRFGIVVPPLTTEVCGRPFGAAVVVPAEAVLLAGFAFTVEEGAAAVPPLGSAA